MIKNSRYLELNPGPHDKEALGRTTGPRPVEGLLKATLISCLEKVFFAFFEWAATSGKATDKVGSFDWKQRL